MRSRPYYTLLHRDGEGRPWRITFGDYSRSLVRAECDYYARDTYPSVRKKNQRIVRTESANQCDIDRLVQDLNVGTHDPYRALDANLADCLKSMEDKR